MRRWHFSRCSRTYTRSKSTSHFSPEAQMRGTVEPHYSMEMDYLISVKFSQGALKEVDKIYHRCTSSLRQRGNSPTETALQLEASTYGSGPSTNSGFIFNLMALKCSSHLTVFKTQLPKCMLWGLHREQYYVLIIFNRINFICIFNSPIWLPIFLFFQEWTKNRYFNWPWKGFMYLTLLQSSVKCG